MSFADRVRFERRACGLKQWSLALVAGISVITVRRIEGGSDPSLSSALKVAAQLGISLDEMMPERKR